MAPKWEDAEEIIECVVKGYNWGVIPARKYNSDKGKSVAPMLVSQSSKEVLPDIIAAKNGCVELIEVKLKTDPTLYRKKDEKQHGIDLDNWSDYTTIQEEFGKRVWLFVLEENTGWILRQKIDELTIDHTHPSGGARGEEMVYFSRNSFDKIPLHRDMLPSELFFGQEALLNEQTQSRVEAFTLFPNGDDSNTQGQKDLTDYCD